MSTFYNKFKEEEKQKEKEIREQQQFKEQNFNTQPIIIQNRSTFKNFIRFLISVFMFFTKGLFYISIMIFASIGVTIMLNESLRNTFIEFIKTVI